MIGTQQHRYGGAEERRLRWSSEWKMGLQLGGVGIAEPGPEVFFFPGPSSTFCICETYVRKHFINILNLPNYSV